MNVVKLFVVCVLFCAINGTHNDTKSFKFLALRDRLQAIRLEFPDRDGPSACVSEYSHIIFQYRDSFLTKSKRMTIGLLKVIN
jgi:hypothetical protein